VSLSFTYTSTCCCDNENLGIYSEQWNYSTVYVTTTHRPFSDISKSKPKLNPVHRQQYYNTVPLTIISCVKLQPNYHTGTQEQHAIILKWSLLSQEITTTELIQNETRCVELWPTQYDSFPAL